MKKRILLVVNLLFFTVLLQSQVSQKNSNSELKTIQSKTEAKSITDQVFADDIIVQGSACIGLDCVNGESFGFNTIRLKENNLRIGADDTSASGSFPLNDWEITFNDSSNGGAEKFSITDVTGGKTPFTIIAGAPNNSMYLNNSGNLGLGTSNPVVDVHTVSGNTPTLRLEQDGSSGFTPQTWDMAGNEANFFIRDATNGSKLPFRIKPSAPTNSISIKEDGNIGLGIENATGPLHVKRASKDLLILDNDGILTIDSSLVFNTGGIKFKDGSYQTTATTPANGGNATFTNLVVDGNLYLKGTMFPRASYSPSDFNLKENIAPMKDATSVIKQLLPKTFYFKKEYVKEMGFSERKQFGLIAQEVEKILPEFVKDFVSKTGKTFKSVNYDSFIPLLIQAFNEQQTIIESQTTEIEQLKLQIDKYADLDSRITAIEKRESNTLSSKNTK